MLISKSYNNKNINPYILNFITFDEKNNKFVTCSCNEYSLGHSNVLEFSKTSKETIL